MIDTRELDFSLPSVCVWVDGVLGTVWEDGSVEFYCDGDVRVPLCTLKEFLRIADRFLYERDNHPSV